MPSFDIEPRVIFPKQPVIRFARTDLLDTATFFRVFFTVFFGIGTTTLGAILGATGPIPIERWILFWVCTGASVAFLAADVSVSIRARREASE